MTMVADEREAQELPERWSAKARAEVVLRLLRGEAVEMVSREIQVPAHELEAWRQTFLEAGADGLKRRHGDPEARLVKQAGQSGRARDCDWNSPRCSSKKGVRGGACEVEEVVRLLSPATGRRHPVSLICRERRVPRSTVYAQRRGEPVEEDPAPRCPEPRDREAGRQRSPPPARRKRGPRAGQDDATVLAAIRAVLEASPFHTEGHGKVRVRLRPSGIRVGKNRVLRLMREGRLLAPTRRQHVHGDRTHGGTIITAMPDELWGTDATKFWTHQEGWCWFFGAIDHCAEDIVGWHVAKVGDRWAALEPIRQGVQQKHGGYAPKIALGLGLRADHGPQYTAQQFVGELRWLGIRLSPSYVGEPECNGIMERWIPTLKAECRVITWATT